MLDSEIRLPGVLRIAKNTALFAAADVINKLMVFLFFIIAARALGAERYGSLSSALAFVTMFAVLTDLGLGTWSAREIARDRGVLRQVIPVALFIKSVAAVCVVGTILITASLIWTSKQYLMLVAICALFIFEGAFSFYFGAVFQGLERFECSVLARVCQAMVLLAGGALLASSSPTVYGFAWVYAVAGAVSVAVSALLSALVGVPIRVSRSIAAAALLLRRTFPLALAALFASVYYWIGPVLLARISGDTAAGLYSAAFRLVLGASFPVFAFVGALYPILSKAGVAGVEPIGELSKRAGRYILMVAIPFGVLGAAMAGPIVRVTYGSGYAASAQVLQVLAWWGCCAQLNTLLSHCLYAAGSARVVTQQTAVSLAAGLALSLLLIGPLGPLGAAVALTVAEVAGLAFMLSRIARRVQAKVRPVALFLLRVALAALIAAVVGRAACRASDVAGLAACAFSYAIAAVALGVVGASDWSLVADAIAKRPVRRQT
ncbi:MAG: flippase [Anaerolineae bacterium]